MARFIDEVADLLTAEGFSNVKKGNRPPSPVDIIVVNEFDRTANTLNAQHSSGSNTSTQQLMDVQVMVRNRKQELAYDTAISVIETLHQMGNRDLGDHNLTMCLATTGVLFVGKDEKEGFLYSTNFQFRVTK